MGKRLYDDDVDDGGIFKTSSPLLLLPYKVIKKPAIRCHRHKRKSRKKKDVSFFPTATI